MCLRWCGWTMDEIRYFLSQCVVIIYLSKLTNQVLSVLVQWHNRLWVLYLDCSRGYLQFDMLVAIVSARSNETCSFLDSFCRRLGYRHKTSCFSLIAGVPDVHPGYYVYQIAPYWRSEEKLRGHDTHTEPPSDNGLYGNKHSEICVFKINSRPYLVGMFDNVILNG